MLFAGFASNNNNNNNSSVAASLTLTLLSCDWSLHIASFSCLDFTYASLLGSIIDEGKAVLISMANPHSSEITHLVAVSSPHVGDWLRALPISFCDVTKSFATMSFGSGRSTNIGMWI